MTCGSSAPLVTAGDRCCPYSTVAARTQRGPSAKITGCARCATVSLRGCCAVAWGLRAEGALSTMRTVEVSRDAEGHLVWR
jgi:hypothetical protein